MLPSIYRQFTIKLPSCYYRVTIQLPTVTSELPARARFDAHTRVVLQHHVLVLVEIQQSDGRHGLGHAARGGHLLVQADRVHDALYGGVIGGLHTLKNKRGSHEKFRGDHDRSEIKNKAKFQKRNEKSKSSSSTEKMSFAQNLDE